MPRYVDADLVLQLMDKFFDTIDLADIEYRKGFQRAQTQLAALAKVHPADVAEVCHGKWVVDKTIKGKFCCWCNICACGVRNKENGQYDDVRYMSYCPNCGARMDKEAAE